MARTKRQRRGGLIWLVISLFLIAALVIGASTWVNRWFSKDAVFFAPESFCKVTVDDISDTLSVEQSYNASIIVGESIRRGLPARAATIALVTAMQESTLRNLDYGDRDSLGLFQQRPSQGWGSAEQIMDPWYSAGKFYDALVKIPDWQNGDINDVAQSVQLSGFPDAYRQHESLGRAWASALTGFDHSAIQCLYQSSAPSSPSELIDFFQYVYGDRLSIVQEGSTLTITAPDETSAWAISQLALLRGQAAGLISVATAQQLFQVDDSNLNSWASTEENLGSNVKINLQPIDIPSPSPS